MEEEWRRQEKQLMNHNFYVLEQLNQMIPLKTMVFLLKIRILEIANLGLLILKKEILVLLLLRILR